MVDRYAAFVGHSAGHRITWCCGQIVDEKADDLAYSAELELSALAVVGAVMTGWLWCRQSRRIDEPDGPESRRRLLPYRWPVRR
jgi:hypothetical protein